MEWIFLTLYNIQYTCTILYVLILNSFPHVCVYVCVKNMPTITAPTIFTVEENFWRERDVCVYSTRERNLTPGTRAQHTLYNNYYYYYLIIGIIFWCYNRFVRWFLSNVILHSEKSLKITVNFVQCSHGIQLPIY